MKVLQLIDSLEAGGAERMAISLANELNGIGIASYLCSTREEGPLQQSLDTEVSYQFLNKRSRYDLRAFVRLKKWVRQNQINIIHTHSSSFFFGYLLKLSFPKITLIWHDHYGNSELLSTRKFGILRHCSRKFDAIISVNSNLKNWALTYLKCPNVHFLNNFVSQKSRSSPSIQVKGGNEQKIVCLANLRPQKDHLNLLKSFKELRTQFDCSLHLFGKSFEDDYFDTINDYVSENGLDNVYFYGSQTGIVQLLKAFDIGVLASKSEGLPVALLEYGLAGLAVVATDVGQTKQVVSNFGAIVPAENSEALAKALSEYLKNGEKRKEDAQLFAEHIKRNYTFEAISAKLLGIYKNPKIH
ncbi:MAG: glycosyltransferase [Flavobacteriaceae bacterium]|nr:glycosyltransferase [Flavobacteriaceae bacterium]